MKLLPYNVESRKEFELVKEAIGLKHFVYEELMCPCCKRIKTTIPFLATLNEIRARYGKPMRVASGYRCPKRNEEVGGAPNSAHLKGVALDVEIVNSSDRYWFVHTLIRCDVRRIGISETFIHFDLDFDLPPEVIWLY